MANGPLGGFMPTPPSPGQPPQVKLETSAESRGAFNKFLGTLPSNGAIAPIQTGVVASSTAPVTPVTSNVNIFQPQMSQMAPMTPMPMMPPAQPVKMMQEGGVADFGDFFDEVTSFADDDRSDFSDSGNNFDEGFTEEEDPDRAGDYQTDESGIFTGTGGDDDPTQIVDTRPVTNIRNVGPTSNLRYDPQFTANLLQQRGLDPQGFMAPADFAQTTQGGATGTKSTVELPSLGLGQNLLTAKPTVSRQDVLTAANRLSDIAPAASVPLAPTSPFFDRDLLDDPLGLGIRTGFGPAVDAIEAGRARARAFPSAGTPVASLGGLRGQVDRLGTPGLTGTALTSGLPSIDTVADDLVQGRGLGENINNPGNIRTGGGFDGEIGKTRDGFAIFDSMQSGVDAINKLSNTYGSKRNIDTVREFANRYSPVGENTAKEVSGKINFLSNALGVGPDDKVDFTDPNVQAVFTPALITSEIGRDRAQNVANVLSGFSPSPLNVTTRDLNPNITSNVDQLATIDPAIPDENRFADPFTSFDVAETNRARIDREQRAIQDRGGRPVFNLGPGQTGVDIRGPLAARLAARLPDQALETLEGRRLRDQEGGVAQGFDEVDRAEKDRLRDELLREGEIAQNFRRADYNLPSNISLNDLIAATTPGTRLYEATKGGDFSMFKGDPLAPNPLMSRNLQQQLDTTNITETALGGRGTAPTTDLTRGPDVSIVGDDERFAELNLRDIVGDTTQERVADILSRPDRFKDTFKIGDVEFPNLIATLANKAGSFFDRRLFDGIVKRGLDAVVDPDTGRIIGAKDEFGNLIEGRDLNQFQPDDGGDPDPIGTFLKKATEDKEEEKDTTPNVFGGEAPRKTLENVPTVVSSPFQARDINFRPVGFDAGNLNKLIERITGVPSPRRMQEGGTVAAVDRFLSKVA